MKALASVLMAATAACSAAPDAPPTAPPTTTTAPPEPTTTPTTEAPPTSPPAAPSAEAASVTPPTHGRPAAPEPSQVPATTAPPPPPAPMAAVGGVVETGQASWYARGARTASGEAFDPDGMTAAHLTLPFGTRLRVCHGGACVVVRITDRGPAAWTGKELDLSRGAFALLAPLSRGVIDVTWEVAA